MSPHYRSAPGSGVYTAPNPSVRGSFIPYDSPYVNPLESPSSPDSSESFTSEDVEPIQAPEIQAPEIQTPEIQYPQTSPLTPDSDAEPQMAETQTPQASFTPDSDAESHTPEFQFPRSSCGDSSIGEGRAWYPVFIDNGDLSKIRSQYCQDAIKTMRTNTNTPSVQIASFTDRDKALRFAQVVGGSVGQSTPSKEFERQAQIDNSNSASQNIESQRDQNSRVTDSDKIAAQPQNNQVSTVSNDNGSVVLSGLALSLGCLFFGYKRLRKNKV
ncbi:hypothetical protein [Leptolyngbya sp. FACHB-1624]|uniref:hypothetical protein n=1 Tax=Leptolyngbya sp. FACHB-1624 TaxID=2692802 RepID=UPI0039E88CA4